MSDVLNRCSSPLAVYIPSWDRRDYDLEKIQDARVNAKDALRMVRYCRTETGEEARRAEVVWISRARSWRKFANALSSSRRTRKKERRPA